MTNSIAMQNLIKESRRLWALYMSADQGDAADQLARRYHEIIAAIDRRAQQERA